MGENELVAVNQELNVPDVARQVQKIQDLMATLMKKDEHYGVIPGTGNKPSLLKAGAEKLCFIFKLAPEFEITQRDLPMNHREYSIKCTLRNMATGNVVGSGVGCCTTMESKYRYRNAAKKCPSCGMETIIRGKEEYGGGWICFAKKGGCGAKFGNDDPAITNQPSGKVDNPDIADVYNTVLKMAKKRAHVDATITACAASDIFTQDIEDFAPIVERHEEAPPEPAAASAPQAPASGMSLHDRIGQVRQEFVDILKDAAFTDEEREKAKLKLNIGKSTSEDYLAYCKTVVNEYEAKLRERTKPAPFVDDIPGETLTKGQELAKKFKIEIPKDVF